MWLNYRYNVYNVKREAMHGPKLFENASKMGMIFGKALT